MAPVREPFWNHVPFWGVEGLICLFHAPNPTAYQGKTSISTVGTSTSAYRLSLATMSRSNTGTGTVWEQDSQPSRQPSQDTLSRTDEDDEESKEHFWFAFSAEKQQMCVFSSR